MGRRDLRFREVSWEIPHFRSLVVSLEEKVWQMWGKVVEWRVHGSFSSLYGPVALLLMRQQTKWLTWQILNVEHWTLSTNWASPPSSFIHTPSLVKKTTGSESSILFLLQWAVVLEMQTSPFHSGCCEQAVRDTLQTDTAIPASDQFWMMTRIYVMTTVRINSNYLMLAEITDYGVPRLVDERNMNTTITDLDGVSDVLAVYLLNWSIPGGRVDLPWW